MYIPRHMRRLLGTPLTFAGALCASVFAFGACSTDESPMAPSTPAAGGPGFLTSDGSPLHSPGLVGFYFLPPAVRDKPSVVGTFDPCLLANATTCPTGLTPIVRICLASVTDCGAATPVATFTTSSTPAIKKGGTGASPAYFVAWKPSQLLPLATYRIHVQAGAGAFQRELGFADVQILASSATPKQRSNATTTQQIGWPAGNSLTINFWIAKGIVGAVTVSPATASIDVGATVSFTAVVRDLHGAPLTGKALSWASATPGVATVDASGLVTGVSAGEAIITATSEGRSSNATVTVINSTAAIDLGTLGGTSSQAQGINESGQVVGSSTLANGNTNTQHAFLWQSGAMFDLGVLPGGSTSTAQDINNNGQVAGSSSGHAFLWTPAQPGGTTGTMADLGTGLGDIGAIGIALNDPGQVVGISFLMEGETLVRHATLWQGGTVADLGTLAGGESEALGINANGQVVGLSFTNSNDIHAFLWTPDQPGATTGTMTDLGNLGGTETYSAAEAQGINNSGQVVGHSVGADGSRHAFLWTPSQPGGTTGAMIDIGALEDGPTALAYAINDLGQVVGLSFTPGFALLHAFLWQDGTMTDLGALPDWTASRALGINNEGQVVGSSSPQRDTDTHATLWPARVP